MTQGIESWERMAPPTEQGPLGQPGPPGAWPTVIGVIEIVFGVLGAIRGVFGIFGPLLMELLAGFIPKDASGAATFEIQRKVTADWAPVLIALAAVSLGVAVLLLIAGINLCRRRPSGANLSVLWAALKSALALGNAIVGYFVQADTLEAMRQAGQTTAGFGGLANSFALAGVVIGLLWALALPVFVLIWFARPAIKREVAGWGV
jgi:hypothetical protein